MRLSHTNKAASTGGPPIDLMDTPQVTVIIPTYNRARFLGEAIKSVLDQQLSDFELIVVDDGSTDTTPELLRAISDPRLHSISQPHRGISPAMNAGIRCTRGQYVARLDSDDLWMPDTLATLVGVLERRSDIGVAHAMGQIIDADGNLLPDTLGIPERFPGNSLRSLLYDDCICNVAMVARRSCFDRAGPYDESLIANEDWDMRLRLARHCSFCFVDRVLARVRWHDDNFTGLRSPRFAAVLDTRTAPLDRLFSDPDLPPSILPIKPLAYTNVYLFRGQRWLQAGEVKKALREFRLALRVSDQPAVTAARAIWLALIVPRLRRSGWGRRAVREQAAWRGRRRAIGESRLRSG
jgi:glycosyltransferase involved in cell wall biosynthesis